MSRLPVELDDKILEYLPVNEACRARRVCKQWRDSPVTFLRYRWLSWWRHRWTFDGVLSQIQGYVVDRRLLNVLHHFGLRFYDIPEGANCGGLPWTKWKSPWGTTMIGLHVLKRDTLDHQSGVIMLMPEREAWLLSRHQEMVEHFYEWYEFEMPGLLGCLLANEDEKYVLCY